MTSNYNKLYAMVILSNPHTKFQLFSVGINYVAQSYQTYNIILFVRPLGIDSVVQYYNNMTEPIVLPSTSNLSVTTCVSTNMVIILLKFEHISIPVSANESLAIKNQLTVVVIKILNLIFNQLYFN